MDLNKFLFKYFVYYPVVWIRGQHISGYLRRLNESQYLSKPELEAFQVQKLRWLVNHSERTVPFYRKTLRKAVGDDIAWLKDLEEMPCITKADIKANSGEFLSSNRPWFLTKKTTGGSTGQPLTIYKSRDAMAWELAASWRGYSWAGIDIGDRQARFWGVPLDWKDKLRAKLIDFVGHRRRCSAFSFDEDDLVKHTDRLRSFNPTYFYGYVSMIYEYAKFFERKGLKAPFQLKCVITTSEVLAEYQRKLIESIFSTRVFNEYGSGELGSIAHECEMGSLHIMAENMIVEILDGNRPCKAGEVGELVVTELNNYVMPLIRYRTGDYASFSEKECKCGRGLQVIENLFGRAYDIIRNREGKLFHGEFIMYVFEEAQRKNLGINAFQVIQEDYGSLKARIVPGELYSAKTEEFISGRIKEGFDQDVVVRFEKVNRIDRAPSGKMRLIIGMGKE